MELCYGILSTSSIAPRFIAAVRAAGAGEVVAVSSRTREKAQEKASLWEIPKAYGSHRELFADEDVNIVYISAVNSQHYPLAKEALFAGKHVVCEKPVALSVGEFDDMCRAAKESGICQELFENHDEKPTNSFLYSLVMDTYSFGYSSAAFADMPINQKVFLAQFETIKKIASEGPCVMIGRCADYALAEFDNCISVFIHADLQTRIRRIATLYDLTDAKAKEKILKADKRRASYYNYYTSKRWGDANGYDLSIDSGEFGIDGSVQFLKQAILLKERESKKEIFTIDPEYQY